MDKRITSFQDGIALAREFLNERRYAEAVPVLRRLASEQPGNEGVLDSLGWTLHMLGKHEDALDLYRSAVANGAFPFHREFDRTYEQAMIDTRSCPTPLRRRARFHALLERLSAVVDLDGSVVECGCYRGLSSHLICGLLRNHDPAFRGKDYHIFDSFQGLGLPTVEDEAPAGDRRAEQIATICKPGAFAASLEEVKRNLAAFPEIEYHPGWIPLTFRELPERDYRFIHLDVDLYDPTLSALEYFYPRVVRGGVIVCDDYSWPGARLAIEEYCAEQDIGYAATDAGQAVIVRN